MTRVIAVLAFTFLFFLFLTPASAQENWEIDEYNTEIAVESTGEVSIQEDIKVNFGSEEKHGIYRDIPYEYSQENGEIYYTEIEVEDVLQNGSKAEYELIRDNGYVRIKIGDPDVTISGENSYLISYIARGVLLGYGDFDELYWNVIGDNWAVPIYNSSVRVTLPQDGIINSTCFVGSFGSTETCNIESESEREVFFRSPRVLLPYEGLTVAVGYEKGMVPLITVDRPKSLFERFLEWPSIATLLIIALFGVSTIAYIWHRFGRDFWYENLPFADQGNGKLKPIGAHETVVVEYTPPDKLRPAEIGALVDEVAHTHDVTSTIVDLATRGFLVIEEVEKKWKFGKNDYTFIKKNKDTKGLLEYEKLLLTHLFKSGEEVKMSSLKQTFYDELAEVKKKLYEEVVRKELFIKDPESVRGKYMLIAVVGIVAAVSLFIFGISREIILIIDLALGVLISGVILLIFSRFMPQRSAKGRELLRRAKGYRLFISTVETHRQRFFEKRNMFNEVLPYAMVFELTDKYIKALSDLELQKQTSTWYHGAHAFSMANFSSSMNEFSSSVGTAISSAPKSSGSSGGGGFSGGGFGGGGGGSW
jgi:hypothetical protein